MIWTDLAWAGLAGFLGAIIMVLSEYPFWKKWGMEGVGEWQINWVMLTWLKRSWKSRRNPILSWTIAGHISHGIVIGIAFRFLLPIVIAAIPAASISIVLDGVFLGFILWFLFTFLGQKAYETSGGIEITNRGLFGSLLSNLVFGIALGLLIPLFPDHFSSLP